MNLGCLGRQGRRPRLPSKIHLDLPAKVGIDFARAFDVRLVEQSTVSWEFWFGLLEQFVFRHGHTNIKVDYVLQGYRLGAVTLRARAITAIDLELSDSRSATRCGGPSVSVTTKASGRPPSHRENPTARPSVRVRRAQPASPESARLRVNPPTPFRAAPNAAEFP